jgi:hypothetical protein
VFRRLCEPLGDAAQKTSRKAGPRPKPKAKNCRKP